MTAQGAPDTTNTTPPGTAPPGTAGAAGEVAKPIPPVNATPAKPTTVDKDGKDSKDERKRVVLKPDDEIPEDAELLELSPRALSARLERATKKELKEHFGTDKIPDIKARLARLDELESEKEAARAAQLTELEKLKEENAKDKAARVKAEADLAEERERVEFSAYKSTVLGALEKVIDPDFAEDQLNRVGRAIMKESKKEIARLQEDPRALAKYVDEWARKRIEEKPKLAIDAAPGGTGAGAAGAGANANHEKEKKQVMLTTGPPGSKPDNNVSGDLAGLTPEPGKPNSMNKAQLKAFKEQLFSRNAG